MPPVAAGIAAVKLAVANTLFAAGLGVGLSTYAAGTFAIFATKALSYAATQFLLNRAARALAPKPSGSTNANAGMEVGYYDSAADGVIIIGFVRTGGLHTIPPVCFGTNNELLQQILALAIHECTAFSDMFIDQDRLRAADIGQVTGTNNDGVFSSSGYKYHNLVYAKFYRGTDGQLVDFRLNAWNADMFPSTFRGRGICYAAMEYVYNADTFKAIPNPTFGVAGLSSYDPRFDSGVGGSGSQLYYDSTTWKYTNNPAIALLRILSDNVFGGGYSYPNNEINLTLAQNAANICSAPVPKVPKLVVDSGGLASTGSYPGSVTSIDTVGITIQKNSGTGGDAWNASVHSSGSLAPEDEPEIAWRNIGGRYMVGLNIDPGTDASYASLDYAMFIDNLNNAISIYEGGVYLGNLTDDISFRKGSSLLPYLNQYYRIYVDNSPEAKEIYGVGIVCYEIDGILVRTRPLNSGTTPLYFDSSIFSEGSSFEINVRPRYSCNGRMLATNDFAENVRILCDAMMGRIIDSDGQWKMYAGAYNTPAFAIDKGDWIGPLTIETIQPRQGGRYNGVRCFYTDPKNNWQRKECYVRQSATYKAQDANNDIFIEMEQALCTNEEEAQMKAEFMLRQSRNQIKIVGRLPPRFQSVGIWETGGVTFDDLDFVSKVFRVVNRDLLEDGSVQLTLVEEQATDWTDLEASEYGAPSQSIIPATNPTTPTAPIGFNLSTALNGALSFEIVPPYVVPVGTKYQIIRHPSHTNANVGTVIYDGDFLSGPLLTVNSQHAYWVRAYTDYGFSPTFPGVNSGMYAAPPGWSTGDIQPDAVGEQFYAEQAGTVNYNYSTFSGFSGTNPLMYIDVVPSRDGLLWAQIDGTARQNNGQLTATMLDQTAGGTLATAYDMEPAVPNQDEIVSRVLAADVIGGNTIRFQIRGKPGQLGLASGQTYFTNGQMNLRLYKR